MSSAANPADSEKKGEVSFLDVIRNATARTYALVSLGGLLASAVILYLFYFSTFGAAVVFVIGALGILFRWSSAPVLFILAVTYVVLFPLGIPLFGDLSGFNQIPGSHFRMADLLLLTACLVHLIGLYRYYSSILAGMPFEAPKQYIKPGAKPTVRPDGGVTDSELWRLFIRAALVVLVGQLVWLALCELKLDFRRPFPITTHTGISSRAGLDARSAAELPNWMSRSLLGVGLVVLTGFVIWFITWYWRLAGMSRDEGRMTLLDTQWAELRRDVNRPEKWRGRMKQKVTGTLPKKGCGTYFLMIGLPGILILLFVILIGCAGGFG